MGNVLWLSAADVERCASMADIIGAVREAFVAYSSGAADAPVRTAVAQPGGTTLTMPAALPEQSLTAVKIVSVYAGNAERGLPAIHGLVAVLDGATGAPVAIMDGAYLTGLRTGAASGAATDLLARPDARVLGLVGTGYQARFQAEAVCAVRPIKEVRVYGRNAARRERFAGELAGYLSGHGARVRAAASAAEAVRGADVVCAATNSSVPVFADADVAAGTHVNGVGSYTLRMREVPAELVRRARVYVDSRAAARAEAGDLLPLVEAGELAWEDVPELGEALAGRAPGRWDAAEVTVFKSVGLAVQDAAAAGLVARRARALGLGQPLQGE